MINHGKTNWILASTLITAFVLSGCVGFTPPSPFPTDPNAQNHYDAGERFLEAQRYEMAAVEFEKSLEFESVAYITHSKLAVAYFGQQKFVDGARQFEATYQLWGGAMSGPGWAILQAVSLQRAGNQDEAETLLRSWSWTLPTTVCTGIGVCYAASRPLEGNGKLLASYLQGSIDETSLLAQSTADDQPFTNLVIGLSNAAKGDTEAARKFLQLAADAYHLLNRSGWSFALARAEMRNTKLQQLSDLREKGIITDAESDSEKKKLLDAE